MRILLPLNTLLLMVILLTGGCALFPKERIITSINDYNLAVEKAQNEMLLLNVVRASMRLPMYFTGFNLLRGSMTYNISTGSVTIPFGKIGTGLNGAYSVAPTASFSSNPSFDVGVLDTKEFIRGIMTPITMETMDYYWQLGWPKELLLHLFVEKVINDGGETLDNYPSNDAGFTNFQIWAKKTSKCRMISKEKPAVGPIVKVNSDVDITKLLEIKKAGYNLKPIFDNHSSNRFQLIPQEKEYYINCMDTNKNYITTKEIEYNTAPHADKMYLRSPEAILYYLGEIIRAKFDKKYDTMITVCSSNPNIKCKIFDVVNPSVIDSSYVSVQYEGTTYAIPSDKQDSSSQCPTDRSMQTLTLISQLISLQKSGENLPTTGVVNVLGR